MANNMRKHAMAWEQERADRLMFEKNTAYREGLFLEQVREQEKRIQALERQRDQYHAMLEAAGIEA